MLYTDLVEIKALLDIDPDDDQEDLKLNFLIEYASGMVAQFLNRPGLFYKQRTEYYNGTGTKKLLLRSRPVYTTDLQVWEDHDGAYGSGDDAFGSGDLLEYGDQYCLQIDTDDSRSRCGILIKLKGGWEKPFVRSHGYLSPYVGEGFGTIKVTYYGGYTVNDLPSNIRLAVNLLVMRLRYILPLGMELSGESYEERNISLSTDNKDYLFSLIRPLLTPFMNWPI